MIENYLQVAPIKAYIKPDIIKSILDSRAGIYVTGSFIIGGATRQSDIDIVVPIDRPVGNLLQPIANRYGGKVKTSDYNNGLKLDIPGLTIINILHLHPLDYAAFLFATDTMRHNTIITDRNARHRCFEELCHAYKSFINPKCVTIDEMYKVVKRNRDAEFMASQIDWEDFYAR